MSYTIETNGNKAVVTLTIAKDVVETGMRYAAEHMSQESAIPGFRAGKAPYDVVKQRVGAMKLLEAAAEELIRAEFVKAMIEEDVETVGQPYFDVVKMVPDDEMIIKAEIALFPHVTKMADLEKLSVVKKGIASSPKEIEQAKKDLSLMQTKEVRKPSRETLALGDKAVVNLTMKKDAVVLEGGESQDHGIYTGEGHYITGLVDKIIGMKEGETRTFILPFPKDHYQKHLAGQDVEFTIEMKQIFSLEAPAFDDAFAKQLGLTSVAELEETLKKNIERENEQQEAIRLEKEVLDLVANKSSFDEIPDLLVNQEIERMMHELEHSLSQRGITVEDYLKNIQKSMTQLKLDFTETALKRIKVGILLKKIAEEEGIKADEKEVDFELDRLASQYEDEKMKKQIYDPQYRDYVEYQLKNKNVIEFLKGKIVK